MAIGMFTEKHEMFRQTLRRFVEDELQPHCDEWEENQRFPREIVPELGKLGCLGITYPEKYGGMGESWVMSLVFHEELFRCHAIGAPMAITSNTDMFSTHINRLGTEEQKQKYLVPIIKGEKFMGGFVTEPDCGSDVAAIKTTAVKKNGYYVINGTKQFATNASVGDYGTILVRTGPPDSGRRGLTMLIIETSTPGYKAVPLKKMAWKSTDTCTVYLDDVRVPEENRLGEENRGFYYQMIGFERERLSLAASVIGVCDQAFEAASKYAKERRAFGQPICKFQAISHRLVDIATTIEAARQLLYKAVELFCAGEEGKQSVETRQACYMAKLFACDRAIEVVSSAAQVFGGYVVEDGMLISRLYRDVRIWNIGGGTSEIQKNIIAGLMGF